MTPNVMSCFGAYSYMYSNSSQGIKRLLYPSLRKLLPLNRQLCSGVETKRDDLHEGPPVVLFPKELGENTSEKTGSLSDGVETKLLKVAIIGRHNTGKSTLINQLVGRVVRPTSMKAHTTRIKARAVQIEEKSQIIYLDTPGLVTLDERDRFKLDVEFVRSAEDALCEADVLGVVTDASDRYQMNQLDPLLLALLYKYYMKKSFLVMNKIDAVRKKQRLLDFSTNLVGKAELMKKFPLPTRPLSEHEVKQCVKQSRSWPHFEEIFMVSALEGDGVGDIKAYLLDRAQPGKWLQWEERPSIKECRSTVRDFVKAALLDKVQYNIPYESHVFVDKAEIRDGTLFADVVVEAKRNSHMRFIIGTDGLTIKDICRIATDNISSALQIPCRLHLSLRVKDTIV